MQKRTQHKRMAHLKYWISGALLLGVILIAGGIYGYHEWKYSTNTYYVNSSAILFTKADKNSKPLSYLGRNSKVTRTGRGYSKWMKVTYKNAYGTKRGYVQGTKLSRIGYKYAQKGTAYYQSANSSSAAGKLADHNVLVKTDNTSGKVAANYDGKTVYVDASKLTTKPVTFSDSYGTNHYTRYNMKHVPAAAKLTKHQVPSFKNVAISDVTNARITNRLHKDRTDQLDVWDSWPLQDGKGNLVNYHGYHVVFAMANDPKTNEENGAEYGASIYMFYQKIGTDTSDISSWYNGGKIFKSKTDGSDGKSKYLKKQTDEWSGSTVVQGTNHVRVFYTAFSGAKRHGGNGYNEQALATAKLKITATSNGLKIDHNATTDHKTIFFGDGKYYQSTDQTKKEAMEFTADDFTLRDPHYIEDNGHKYLVFEGNTGTKLGGPAYSDNNNYNYANIGGSKKYQKQVQKQLVKNRNTWNGLRNQYTNGAIGIVELTNHYTVKKVMKPLVTFNGVDDETERPNIFKKNGKWYLFTDTRGTHMLKSTISRKGIFMLGFSANKLTGPYKPLNGKSGVVLSSTELNPNNRRFTYSYFVINNPNSNNLVVTSYMTKAGDAKLRGGHSTFAPSFLLNINGNRTSVVANSILPQGALTNSVFAGTTGTSGTTTNTATNTTSPFS
ncbi:glycoside hydrolase family 68 protein [Nicoliella spurrieriana]|uniref:Glycoside hydrolase family 68 protein n=1 Tax=Nicoliella spurrieriana TaxID=2925830 RepID=A0A976RSP2_9LACO|nr:glycoside hydrolase family 68 protein [Nicoliella spurrieriana]UQS87127.1 glycoside hydrolase family 68 protein [Nicoliella spurrieriana]